MQNLDGMHLMMMQVVDDETSHMVQWLETDVAAALAAGYLHRLHFVISHDSEGKDLIEQYTYTFQYTDKGAHGS